MSKKPTCLLWALLLWACSLCGQEVKTIALKDEKIEYPLKNYYIRMVKDDRPDTSGSGSIRTGLFGGKSERIQLQDGASAEIFRFIRQNAGQDSSTNPIVLHISLLKVEETGRSGLTTENELSMGLTFYMDTVKLVEYTGGGTAKSTGDPSKLIEELIRGNIGSMLHQFDEWWLKNRSFYIAIQTKASVKVEVSFDQQTDDADVISYTRGKVLTLADFQGKPDEGSTAAAITYSILIMTYSSIRTVTNEIIVDVSVLANFIRSKSWCKELNRNEETLRHEQGHFDLSAIKACELVDTIRKFPFTVENFGLELDRLQRLKQAELIRVQDLYDRDTGHGSGSGIQARWDRKIKEDLQKASCFHS
jgi:hypothetical protein